jgi:hypothetical protein
MREAHKDANDSMFHRDPSNRAARRQRVHPTVNRNMITSDMRLPRTTTRVNGITCPEGRERCCLFGRQHGDPEDQTAADSVLSGRLTIHAQ